MKKKVMVLVGEIEVDFDPQNYVEARTGYLIRTLERAAQYENRLIAEGDYGILDLLAEASDVKVVVREIEDADVPPVG